MTIKQLLPILILAAQALTAADLPKILVHGHRGARARMPENTIPAFRYAIEQGADVLETDMAVTKDNVVVLSHDPRLSEPICAGPASGKLIRELTLAETRQWDCGAVRNPGFPEQRPVPGTRIPTLDDLLSLASLGKFEFNIETKSFPENPSYTPDPGEFARLVLQAIRKHGLEKRVILQSFDFRTLAAMRKLAPEIRLSALTQTDQRDFAAIAADAAGAEIVSPLYSLVTREKVAAAHKAGIQVAPWTANNVADWDKLIDAGVDAIITDDPAALIAHLKQRGLR
jgi:glycerophosphoryl diester phosphodiesterase